MYSIGILYFLGGSNVFQWPFPMASALNPTIDVRNSVKSVLLRPAGKVDDQKSKRSNPSGFSSVLRVSALILHLDSDQGGKRVRA